MLLLFFQLTKNSFKEDPLLWPWLTKGCALWLWQTVPPIQSPLSEAQSLDLLKYNATRVRLNLSQTQKYLKFLKALIIFMLTQPLVKSWGEMKLLTKSNLMSTEFQSRYLDLLFKHRRALSISRTNLGKAKSYFHKIHLKDNNSVYRKQFKMPEAHSEFIFKNIDDWLKLGVVRRSSMYNSLIFVLPKRTVMVCKLYKI